MPRLLYDTRRSEKLTRLSVFGRCMFYHMVSMADDFGNMPSNLLILKNELFPIENFRKYFPKEARSLDTDYNKYENGNVPEADAKKLRAKYVTKPVRTEVDKFVNYYLAEIERWNQLKLSSKFFVWLDRKIEYEKRP